MRVVSVWFVLLHDPFIALILIFRLQIFRKKSFTSIAEFWRFWAMEDGKKCNGELLNL